MDDIKRYLQYDELEYKVFMPNEIFVDLKFLHEKGSSHVAFTYSYYYLKCWLYRYAKYGLMNINTKAIKEILGYSPIYKEIDYIIKKNGILDKLNYTLSDNDYPISWTLDNLNNLEFTMFSELDKDMIKEVRDRIGKNFKYKIPVKGLWRTEESKNESIEDGTFFDISNTHMVSFEIFTYCMENKDLGCIGFYLYSYLKYRIQWFEEFTSSIERISNDTGIKQTSTETYIHRLLLHRLIDHKVNECTKVDGEYKRIANTYKFNKKVEI